MEKEKKEETKKARVRSVPIGSDKYSSLHSDVSGNVSLLDSIVKENHSTCLSGFFSSFSMDVKMVMSQLKQRITTSENRTISPPCRVYQETT